MDFWNFKDFLFVAASNWFWLLLALILGLIVGWLSCVEERAGAR